MFVDSEVLVAKKIENNYMLSLIYRISSESEWYSEDYGIWSKPYGLNKSSEIIFSATIRRKDLRGLTIVTSLIISDNRTKYELYDFRNLLVDTVTKTTVRHLTPLYHFMNATKAFVFTDNWGYYINGSWNGMIGDLARGDADLGGSLAFITKERLAVVEYLSHPTPITAKFVFREPPLSYQHNLFLLPFKTTVWCCIGAFIVLVLLILYINAHWDIKKFQHYRQKTMDFTALRPNLSDITIFLISAMAQQGSHQELKGTLGRLVMFILFLTFVFLYTSYSASIVALLQSSSNQIRSLNDLLHSKLELGVEDVPYNKYYFSTATEPIRKAIYETKVAPKGSRPNFMNIDDGVKKLRNEPFAFNMNTGIGYKYVEKYFLEHQKCGLQEIEYIENNTPWLPCKKHSPFREIYKVGLFRVNEHGLGDRENQLVYAKKPACTARGGNFGSVNMIDFYPVLLLLLYGMITAFLLLFLEIFIHQKQMALTLSWNSALI
ncbi:glutamate receptor ionotropic, delta-1-like [Manduca sexta]|uniref:glutamate receptor ionotropic, delta-1-like n=1 Tax=Manduca sexta TaxID=7130 RepID=UPI0018903174|nr:glutamate receptor ionotropic, delta-1-like [Manduca sexta]